MSTTALDSIDTALVLAPHTDDGELGCGGTISRLIEAGRKVIYVAFSTCKESVPEGFPEDILEQEVKKATGVLGIPGENLIILDYRVRWFTSHRQEILEDMVRINRTHRPDLVLLPSSYDVHQDHHTIYEEGRRAFKRTTLLGYELPWNNFEYASTCYIALQQHHLDRKVKAMEQYESQNKRGYTSSEIITNTARFRGMQAAVELAEAFEVIRWIIR